MSTRLLGTAIVAVLAAPALAASDPEWLALCDLESAAKKFGDLFDSKK